jgi:hypothetical protein
MTAPKKTDEERELEAKLRELRHKRKPRPLGRKRSKGRGGNRSTDAAAEARRDFIGSLLDRSATTAQVIAACRRPPSTDPSKPGGLGLSRAAAQSALYEVLKRRQKDFAKETPASVRAAQSYRLLGSVSAAVADKQFGAVAALERNFARLHGTDAPPINPRPHGTTGEIVSGILGGMSEAEILGLAGEDDEEQEDDE